VKPFRQSYPVIERGFDDYRMWTRGVVERVKRGEAAPRAHSLAELIVSGGTNEARDSERDDQRAAAADRRNAIYMSDEAIAARAAKRVFLRQAYAEMLAENRAKAAVQREREAEEAQARHEAKVAWEAQQQTYRRERLEREALWRFEERTRQILAAKWQCIECLTPGGIRTDGDGFVIYCNRCKRQVHGTRAKLEEMMKL
jgi:hypothetical protein